jgi:hypothetical protein
MKKFPPLIGLLSTLLISQTYAADDQLDFSSINWTLMDSVQKKQASQNINSLTSRASKDKSFNVNINLFEQVLGNDEVVTIDLPLPNGQFATFKLFPSSVMNNELAAKYPSIKTFTGYQVDKPEHQGNFDITPHGFHGVFTFENDKVFIDPIRRDNNSTYHSYFRQDAQPLSLSALGKRLAPKRNALSANDKYTSEDKALTQQNKANEIITYRIAVATTGEYSAFHGGTKELSLAAVVTMLNRVNEVYQRDLAIQLELIANNDSLIFIDAETDPFQNTSDDINVNTEVINKGVGVDSYDIGHVVGTGAGGLAQLGAVCGSLKAEGLTGSDSPTNDAFNIDYVAHEIGHQFGADHTFNGASGGCGGNRETSSAYEPGSASTIMGYAGICDAQNLQNNSDAYFHIRSIDQIITYTRSGTGNTCGAKVTQTNQAPTVDAGSDYTIPARTPFTLKGQGTDNENDSLTYSWEQFDLGTMSESAEDDKTDVGNRPLFRVFAPTQTGNERVFPRLTDILSGKQTHGEALPTTTRDLNFRLVVRDNKGNVSDDAMKVSVVSNFANFSLTEPSTGSSWQGSEHTVTWNTASSEQAPVSCSAVNILLSTDSGNTFSQELMKETPNDGSQVITLSDLNTTTARVKIICSNNIFFAINSADFAINSSGTPVEPKPIFASQKILTVAEDNTLTLNINDLTFSDNKVVDSIAIVAGDNYQVAGLNVIPNSDYHGELLVKTTATKGQLTSDEFNVKVTVSSVNDAPVAIADAISFIEASTNNSIDVIANDVDTENDTLTIKSISYSGTGVAVIESNKVVYTPESSFTGIETISYIINDGQDDSVSATLTITVTAKTPVPVPTPTPDPEPEPTPEPEIKKSSGGAAIYLLILLITATRRFKGIK